MKDLKDWVGEYQELSMKEMDELVQSYKSARDDYDEKKKISNEADAKVKDLRQKILDVLAACGKTKYAVDGLGQVEVAEKLKVTTPKGEGEKRAMFNWIRDKYGEATLEGLLTCNYATLNSFYNQAYEEAGKPADFKVPGLEDPVLEQTLKFRSERKK